MTASSRKILSLNKQLREISSFSARAAFPRAASHPATPDRCDGIEARSRRRSPVIEPF
jgi:hypothetical protein